MIAALLLLLAPLAGGEPGARWILTPRQAQIGEPVECRLEIRAPLGSAVLLPDKDPALDPAWVLLEARRVERAEQDGELLVRLTWKLLALEPGTRAPFAFEVPVEAPGGRVSLKPAGGELVVLAALGEGEDAPRPQRGFLPPPETEPSRAWIAWSALGLLAAGAAALPLGLRWRRARARRAARPPATALERLAALEQAFAAEQARGRETVFALTHLVRERTDARLENAHAALPDEEWLRLVSADPRLPPAAREASQRLLGRADEVKYALATPSRFLVEELCADARVALQAQEAAA